MPITVEASEIDNSESLISAPEKVSDTVVENTPEYKEEPKEELKDAPEAELVDNPVEEVPSEQETIDSIINEAASAMSGAKNEAAGVETSTEEGITIIAEGDITSGEAFNLMGDAEDAIIDAEDVYDQASAKYDAALTAYNQAVEEYNTLLNDYNTALDSANQELATAEENLAAAESELEELRQQLVQASAEALGAAEDSDVVLDTTEYISAIIENEYIPSTENLADGQTISNYTVVGQPTKGETTNTFVATYEVLDSEGNHIRNGYAECTYYIDTETNQVVITTTKLQYTYINADGNEQTITQEEYENLPDNKRIAIDEYWTTSGSYTPRFETTGNYKNIYSPEGYSDSRAIEDGAITIENQLQNEKESNKTNIEATFDGGTRTEYYSVDRYGNKLYTNYYSVDINYNVYYDVIGLSWVVSDGVSATHYATKEAAEAAVLAEAKEKGAYTINYANSNLTTEKQTDYADVNTGFVFGGLLSGQQDKVNGYYSLLQKYETAQSKVNSLGDIAKTKSENVSAVQSTYSTVVNAAADLTEYEIRLQAIEADSQAASTSIENAYEYLDTMWDAYIDRFDGYTIGDPMPKPTIPDIETELPKDEPVVTPSEPTPGPVVSDDEEVIVPSIDPIINPVVDPTETPVVIPVAEVDAEAEDTVEEINTTSNKSSSGHRLYNYIVDSTEETEEEIVEEPVEQEETTTSESSNDSGKSSQGGSGSSALADSIETEIPAEPESETTTIVDEPTPEGITVAGIMARGKWFVALGGVSIAGVGVGLVEFKRRAAMKIIDKLNQ